MTDFSPRSTSRLDDRHLILSLGGYEGPIDLLLGLARQKRIDLKHISMTTLAQQYIDFIARAKSLHLAIKAEYLVMAAHLTRMKARLLLPRDNAESEKAEKSLDALRENLIWVERAREAARMLRTLPRLGSEVFACGAVGGTLPDSVVAWEIDATLFELLQVYGAIERRRERKTRRLHIRSLNLYDTQDARSALKAQLDEQWRDLAHLIPAAVYRRAEKEENPKLFLKSVISGFFSAALELACGRKDDAGTTQESQKPQKVQKLQGEQKLQVHRMREDIPSDERSGAKRVAYAELYQPSPTSPLQLRLRGERAALTESESA